MDEDLERRVKEELLSLLEKRGFEVALQPKTPGKREMDEDLEDLERRVKEELHYPEEWDTMAYPTVWDALWESYSALKDKVEILEQRIEG